MMTREELLAAMRPFLDLAREVTEPGPDRDWLKDSKDWMVIFSFAGFSVTLGDLRKLAALPTVKAEESSQQPEPWLPISTAPKDGTRVLVAWAPTGGLSEHVELGKWSNLKGWCNTYGHGFNGDPDRWAPLAPFPAPTEARTGQPDTDAVCTSCRQKGAHAADCPRRGEPWPTIEAESSPRPAAWVMRDWAAGKIEVTLSEDERDLWKRRGAEIEPLFALPTPPKA